LNDDSNNQAEKLNSKELVFLTKPVRSQGSLPETADFIESTSIQSNADTRDRVQTGVNAAQIIDSHIDLVVRIGSVFLGINLASLLILFCSFGVLLPIFVGLVSAEIAIVAVMVALGPGQFWHRSLVSYAMFFVAFFCGFAMPLLLLAVAVSADGDGFEMVFWLLLLPVMMLGLQIPCLAMRFFRNWRISNRCDEKELPYGIADFLFGIFSVAICLACIQAFLACTDLELSDVILNIAGGFVGTILFGFVFVVPATSRLLDSRHESPKYKRLAVESVLLSLFLGFVLSWIVSANSLGSIGLILITSLLVVIGWWVGWIVCVEFVSNFATTRGYQLFGFGKREAEITYVAQPETEVDPIGHDDSEAIE